MADLPSIANRLNDVEINNNAPVSSQTFRRVGSDINYLLDLVGANNGDTNPTGPLGIILRPVATITYNYTLTNSPLNTDITLFTFTGGGDRPLSFFKRASGLSIPGSGPFQLNPIQNLLNFAANTSGGVTSFGAAITFKVNGIVAGTVGVPAVFQPWQVLSYSREIYLAPNGLNTVTVTKNQATLGPSSSLNFSDSFEYVAL